MNIVVRKAGLVMTLQEILRCAQNDGREDEAIAVNNGVKTCPESDEGYGLSSSIFTRDG